MNAVVAFLNRPGVKASEFKVLAACTIWVGLNLGERWVPVWQSLIPVIPGLVYGLARGLAKFEQRPSVPAPTPPPGP